MGGILERSAADRPTNRVLLSAVARKKKNAMFLPEPYSRSPPFFLSAPALTCSPLTDMDGGHILIWLWQREKQGVRGQEEHESQSQYSAR